jgi:hypothetical protein
MARGVAGKIQHFQMVRAAGAAASGKTKAARPEWSSG